MLLDIPWICGIIMAVITIFGEVSERLRHYVWVGGGHLTNGKIFADATGSDVRLQPLFYWRERWRS